MSDGSGVSSGAVEVRDLMPLSQTLAKSAESIEALGAKAPQIPDAGLSTGLVADTLAALCQSMSTMVDTTARAADKLAEHAGCYIDADEKNAQIFKSLGGKN